MSIVKKKSIQSQSSDPKQELQNLIYGLSHDMGAPLRAVVQFSQLLSLKLDGKLDEKERYWLQLICDNGKQAQEMIQSLLNYSRLETNIGLIKRFELDSVIQPAIDQLSNKIMDSGAVINYVACHHEIEGDVDQWKRLFFELLNNALLFQVQGENVQPKINIEIDSSKRGVNIRIEDNGIGVPENKWNEITRPFKRLNRNDEYPGAGMGLSICERIIRMHGWNLSFANSSLGGLAVNCSQIK